MTERRLPGGRSFGAVRVGDEVRRPAQPRTAAVHSVLRHPEEVGFDGALGQVGAWLRRLHDATAAFRPAGDAAWFTGRAWQPGLVIAHLDASPWNAVWAGGALADFVDWDTASPSRREDDLAFSALTGVPLLTAEIAGPAGFGDPAGRPRRLRLLLDAYGYAGDPTAIRDAIIRRVERNVTMIRQFADGGEPAFQRMLPWAADLEQSGNEVAGLPDGFWRGRAADGPGTSRERGTGPGLAHRVTPYRG